MSDPLAYFLTWTTHGTWLHGDDRGSVDRHQNNPGMPYLQQNHAWADWSRSEMHSPPVVLSPTAIALVEKTIEAHCLFRGWSLIALNVRSNHAHVIAAALDRPPNRVMDELKAWCTRRLRETGLFARDVSIWTEKGSKRQLWSQKALQAAVSYVVDGQGPELTE